MNIAITGSSGFVGGELKRHWDKRHRIVHVSREELYGDVKRLVEKLNDAEAIVHLSGKPIITRWTRKARREMFESRVVTTRNIVQALKELHIKPKVFLSASAIGIYEDGELQDEKGKRFVSNDLRNIIEGWENEAKKAADLHIRTVMMRFGLILGKNGGLMKKLRLPFLMGVGGIIGSGKQGFSFIHIYDLVRAIDYFLQNEKSDGIYNITAPSPVTNREFAKTLGKIMKRPVLLRFPSLMLKMVFSGGSIALTSGQKIIPGRLMDEGFEFMFPDIESALTNLYKK